MTSLPSIGFAGLGLMGRPIATRIAEAGYPLSILPGPRRSGVDALVAAGARVVETEAELAAASGILLTCLPSSREVEMVLRKALAGARPGLVVIDLTSADPTSTLALAAACEARGVLLRDAAMAGAPEQAENGELTLMVGSETELDAPVRALLDSFAKGVVRTGPTGTGHRTKLIMSFIGMALAAASAEALLVAQATGVDLEALRTLVGGTGMNSSTFQAMAATAMDGDTSRRKLTIANARKDMSYFAEMVREAGLATLVAPATLETLSRAAKLGYADAFVPALTGILGEINGLPGQPEGHG